MQYPEFSTTSAAFISGMAQAVVNDVNSRRRATDEDCRCGGKFWTMYVFYWIYVFLKLPFAVSFSVLLITIQYAAFRIPPRTFYVSLYIYIYINIYTVPQPPSRCMSIP